MQASWWEGLVPALWWEDLESWPSGGQGHVKGCVLRWMSAPYDFRQSVCWWVCYVPILLVVWPEAFSTGAYRPLGWDWVLVPKWGHLGKFTPVSIPWGLCYQYPCSFTPQWITGYPPRPLCMSSPACYGGAALYVPSKSGVPFPPALWNDYTQASLPLKAICSVGSSSQYQTLRLSWRTIFM